MDKSIDIVSTLRSNNAFEAYLEDHAGNKVLISTRDIEVGDSVVCLENNGKVLSKGNKTHKVLTVRNIFGRPGWQRVKFFEAGGSFSKSFCFQINFK